LVASETTLREAQDAAHTIGVQIDVFRASTGRGIEEAFAAIEHEAISSLFVSGDSFFFSRGFQFATLAMRHRIAMCFPNRELLADGGLMSYGTNLGEMFHQVGVYVGQILKGAKPADLPVVQSTKFEFVINLKTAKALGIDVPPTVLALADEVIE